MTKRTEAHKRADKKYQASGKRPYPLRAYMHINAEEKQQLEKDRGEESVNAYMRRLVLGK